MTPKDLDVPSRGFAPKASWIWHPLHENSSRDGAEKMSGTTGLLGRCLFGLVSRHSPNAVEKSDLWRIHFHIGTRARKPFTWSAAVRFFCRSFFSRKCLTVIPWFKHTLDKYGMPRVDKKATDTDNQMSKWFVIPRSLEFSIYTHGTWTLSHTFSRQFDLEMDAKGGLQRLTRQIASFWHWWAEKHRGMGVAGEAIVCSCSR